MTKKQIKGAKDYRQEVAEITKDLETKIRAVFDSDAYKAWLDTASKFWRYSLNNQILIMAQMPTATQVASYKTWRSLGRHVKAGEHGIKVIVPVPVKIRKKQDQDGDPDDEDGVIGTRTFFKIGHVFDISQTDGDPLPTIGVSELTGSVERYQQLIDAITRMSPVPVWYGPLEGHPSSAKGYYSSTEKEIVVRDGMSETQMVKTLLHEIAHALIDQQTEVRDKISREENEQCAESTAYTVSLHFGIDTSEYSFAYIAGWADGRELTQLREHLNLIRDLAALEISGIEAELADSRSCPVPA